MKPADRQLISEKAKSFIFDTLMEHRDLTVADVLSVLGELAAGDAAAAPKPKRPKGKAASTAKSAPASSTPPPPRKGNVVTRTKAGREAFDKAILAALAKLGPNARAVKIRGEVGGTAAQVRTALNRLIEDGKATFDGKASATTYSLKA